MAKTTKVKLGWEGDDGAPYVVRVEVRFGTPRPADLTPESRWVPGDEDDVVEVLSVTEDRPGGVEREDLVAIVQEEIDSGDVLRVEAIERATEEDEPDADDARDFYADESLNAQRESEV